MVFIKNEQANTSIELVQLQSGVIPPPKKRKYIRLNIIREKYISGELEMNEYLLKIANNLATT